MRRLTIPVVLLSSTLAACAAAPQERCLETSWEWLGDDDEVLAETATTWNPQGDRVLHRNGAAGSDTAQVTRDIRSDAGWLEATEVRQGVQPDGLLLAQSRYEYDDRGFLIRSWDDLVDGGAVVGRLRITVIENDPQGRPVRFSFDAAGDGTADQIVEGRYNPRGDQTSAIVFLPDGTVTEQVRWTYTPSGLLREHTRRISTGEGWTESRVRHDYEGGDLVRTRMWEDDELVSETEQRWEDGLLVEQVGVTHPDGEVSFRIEHVYEGDPWPAVKVTFDSEDREILREAMTWDDRGNLLTYENSGELTASYRERYTWTCLIPEPYPDAD